MGPAVNATKKPEASTPVQATLGSGPGADIIKPNSIPTPIEGSAANNFEEVREPQACGRRHKDGAFVLSRQARVRGRNPYQSSSSGGLCTASRAGPKERRIFERDHDKLLFWWCSSCRTSSRCPQLRQVSGPRPRPTIWMTSSFRLT
jgi:hypothetical protein